MRAASSSEIKAALKHLNTEDLSALCLRLVRFKKENKELISFILFESQDIDAFIDHVKEEISEAFQAINRSSLYIAKKSIRKILRDTNKHIRYASSGQVEVELLIHFSSELNSSGISFRKSPAIFKLYLTQLKKLRTAISEMHEDLQYDYTKRLDELAAE